MTAPSRIFAVVPAAGVGRRMNGNKPKQYMLLNGTTVLEHSLGQLLREPRIQKIIVVVSPDDQHWKSIEIFNDARIDVVEGGKERCHSVLNGLKHLYSSLDKNITGGRGVDDSTVDGSTGDRESVWGNSRVLVHDVARPCINLNDIQKLIVTLQHHPVGGILAVPVVDTLKQVSEVGTIEKTIDRSHLWQAQTPQMFPFELLLKVLSDGIEKETIFTDEASALEFAGYTPLVIEGSPENIKVTRPEDLALAEFYLSKRLV